MFHITRAVATKVGPQMPSGVKGFSKTCHIGAGIPAAPLLRKMPVRVDRQHPNMIGFLLHGFPFRDLVWVSFLRLP